MKIRLEQERGHMFSLPQEMGALGHHQRGFCPWKAQGEVGTRILSRCTQVSKCGSMLEVKVASPPSTLPQVRPLENRRLTHKQEQQEACGQWEEDSVGAGQEVLVDDMLAVNERLAPRARALVSTA